MFAPVPDEVVMLGETDAGADGECDCERGGVEDGVVLTSASVLSELDPLPEPASDPELESRL